MMSNKKTLISKDQLPEVLRLLDLGIPVDRVAIKFGTSQALILQIKILRELPDYDVNYTGKTKLCKDYAASKAYSKYEEKGVNKIQKKFGDNMKSHKGNNFAKISKLF
jgi:hypothetical protein